MTPLFFRIHPADATMAALLGVAIGTAAVRYPLVGPPLLVYLVLHTALLAGFLALAAAMLRWEQARWVQFARPAVLLLLISILFTSLGKMGVVAMPYLADAALSRIDRQICGIDPSLSLQHYLTPGRVEFFSFIYWAFLPYLYLSVILGCLGRPPLERDQFLTGWIFTYALGYLGYIFVPAHGPISFHEADYHVQLAGGFFYRQVLQGVDMAGGLQGVFPSLHGGGALYLCLFDLKTNRLRGLTYLPMVVLIYVSTMVLRYHYVIDLIVGTAIAICCVPAGQRVLLWWVHRREAVGDTALPGGESDPASTMSIPVNEDEQNNEARPASSQTRRETLLLDWAADILLTRGERPSSLGREEPSPAEKIRLRRRLQEGYHSLPQGFLEEVEQLSHRVRRYRKQLFHLGIHPSEVFLTLHPASAGLFVIREMELVLVGSPLALAGTVNLLPSYLLIQIVTRAEALDRSWTNSPVSSRRLLIIAACSLAQVGAAWILLSPWWAALYSLTLPYTDYYMLLYRERTARAFRRARTFLFLLRNPQRRESLTREGREIIAQIQDLARRLKEQENDPTVRSE